MEMVKKLARNEVWTKGKEKGSCRGADQREVASRKKKMTMRDIFFSVCVLLSCCLSRTNTTRLKPKEGRAVTRLRETDRETQEIS